MKIQKLIVILCFDCSDAGVKPQSTHNITMDNNQMKNETLNILQLYILYFLFFKKTFRAYVYTNAKHVRKSFSCKHST